MFFGNMRRFLNILRCEKATGRKNRYDRYGRGAGEGKKGEPEALQPLLLHTSCPHRNG